MPPARIAIGAYRGTMSSGGLGRYLTPLTRELASRGYGVDVFVGPPYPDAMPWARVFRIPNQHYWERHWSTHRLVPLDPQRPYAIFEPLNFYEHAVSLLGFFPETFSFSLRMARAVLGEMRGGTRYALVHDVQSLGYGLLWLRALGLPCMATIHHPLSVDRRFSLAQDRTPGEIKGSLTFHPVRTQSRVARRLDAILTSSAASIEELATSYRVPRARIQNVGNGVELPEPGTLRSRPMRPELLFLGRCHDPNKGFEYLLKALNELPEEITLRVMDQRPDRGSLPDLLRIPGLRERIHFEGKRPRAELEQRLRSAAVLVMPSLFEGFGLPAIEALAVGTPVVATSAGALPEVIARAGSGICVSPRSASALAGAIQRTLESWPVAHREALDARDRLESEFGWPAVVDRTLEVYQQAWNHRHATR